MTNYYSVIFRGDIVLGKNLVDVKQKLAQLFKVDDARIERMFIGRPVPLKANIALVQAKKYQAVLAQVGVVTTIIDSSADMASNAKKVSAKSLAQKTSAADTSPMKTSTAKPPVTVFSLAPAGSDLLDDRQQRSHTPVDIAHIALSPQEGNIVKDDERLAPLPATVDADDLEWDIADAGEVLLQDSDKVKIEPLSIDTDTLSLADAGSNLLKEEDRHSLKVVEVDISHLKLAPYNPFM
jgi:hypothetical protein